MKEKLIKYYQNNQDEFKKNHCINKDDYEYIDYEYIRYFIETSELSNN